MLNKECTFGFVAILIVGLFTACSGNITSDLLMTLTPQPLTPTKLANTSTASFVPPPSPTVASTATVELALHGTIAFTNISKTHSGIALLNLEDKTIKGLSNNGSDTLSSSPNGVQIAFNGGIPPAEQLDIFTIKIDGSDFTRLTNSPEGEGDVAWSPDGQTILYSYSNQGRPSDLALVNVKNHASHLLTSTKGSEIFASWSPDGKQIAYLYVPYPDWPAELWIMDASGQKTERLINSERLLPGRIDWSPDGKWIAFVSEDNSLVYGDIFIVRPDGSDLTRLTNFSDYARDVVWSPDGNYLAFIGRIKDDSASGSSEYEGMQIYVMDLKGENVTALTNEKEWILHDLDWLSTSSIK